MTVTFDAASSGNAGNASSKTVSHTVGSGSDRVLIIDVVVGESPDTMTVNSVTYNGTSATSLAKRHSNDNTVGYVEKFVLINPDSGTHDIVATLSAAAHSIIVGGKSYAGASQTLADYTGSVVSAVSGTGNPSVNITTTSSDSLVDDCACNGSAITAVGANQTQRWTEEFDHGTAAGVAAGSTEPGNSGTVTMSWSASDDWAAIIAVEVLPSAGGGAVDLVIQNAAHAVSSDNVALTQVHSLAVADAAHAVSSANVALTGAGDLEIQDAAHAVSSGNVALTQDHDLVVADAAHAVSSDNVDLEENAPGTEYRLFDPGTFGSPPDSNSSDSTNIQVAVEFEVDSDADLTSAWFYNPSDGTTNTRVFRLWDAETTSLVYGPEDFGSNATGQWNELVLSTPYALTPGNRYRAAVYHPGGNFNVTFDFWSTGDGADGITNGPLYAPDDTDAIDNVQNAYTYFDATVFPTSVFSASNYWTDVTVTAAGAGADLEIQNAAHAVSSDNVALTQVHSLAVANAAHAVSSDNVALTGAGDLVVQNAAHAVSSDNVDLTQVHSLVVQDAAHAVTSTEAGLYSFITAVGGSGTEVHLVDQSGDPILLKGCSPWLMMTYLSESEMEDFFALRQSHGFNTAIVTLCPPLDWQGRDGDTVDNVYPFTGMPSTIDVTSPNETYWARVDAMFALAAEYGFTILATAADWWGWADILGDNSVFVAQGTSGWETYGEFLGARYGALENVLWLFGHDYEFDKWAANNQYFEAIADGLATGGATQLATVHNLRDPSRDNTGLEDLIGFDLTYNYVSIYTQTLNEYALTPSKPVIHGETGYEGENNDGQLPGPAEADSIRRQLLWSLTSGARGSFYGHTDEWKFGSGWETSLSTTAVTQVIMLLDWWETLDWTTIQPDDGTDLLTAGRGTHNNGPLTSTYATVGRDTSGTTPASLAVIYIPDSRTVSIDESKISGSVVATWKDPSSGDEQAATGSGGDYTTPGNNDAGDEDWLLILEGTGASDLVIQNSAHAVSSDNVALTQVHSLAVANAAHAVSSDNVALTGAGDLEIQDAAHAVSSGNVALTQVHSLAVANAAHAVSSDNVVLEPVAPGDLEIQDAAHAVSSDSPALTQVHILAIADSAHAVSSTTMAMGTALVVQNAAHAVTSDGVALTQVHVLAVQNAAHSQSAQSAVLTQVHQLLIANASHAVSSGEVVLILGVGGVIFRWDRASATFKYGGTLRRWDGSAFVTGGTLRRWDETDELFYPSP